MALKPEEEESDVLAAAEREMAEPISIHSITAPPPPAQQVEAVTANGLLGEDDLPEWLRTLSSNLDSSAGPAADPQTLPAWVMEAEAEVAQAPIVKPATEQQSQVWSARPAKLPTTEAANSSSVLAAAGMSNAVDNEPRPAATPSPRELPAPRPFRLYLIGAMVIIALVILVVLWLTIRP